MAREREQALREVEERALYEDEAERRDLDQQRREREGREKEMKKFKAFLNLRKEMMDYNFRKCPRIKKESFTDLQIVCMLLQFEWKRQFSFYVNDKASYITTPFDSLRMKFFNLGLPKASDVAVSYNFDQSMDLFAFLYVFLDASKRAIFLP